MTPNDRVPPPTYATPGATAEGAELDVRFVDFGNHMAVVMHKHAWAVFLDVMHAAAPAGSDLDTIYQGFKHGLGFRAPEELLAPPRPEVTS